MNFLRPTTFLARLAGLTLLCASVGRGADAGALATAVPPDSSATVASDPYPQVTCTGSNPAIVDEVIQMAEDMRQTMDNGQNLTKLLKLGKTWRFPVHIILVDPGTPLAEKVKQEEISVVVADKTLKITAALPASDPNAREFIQRQFVTALLWEKYFKSDTQFSEKTRLDVVPIWLIEGLRERISDDPDHNREEIVKRAALAERAPTLAEVTGWDELSDDRLLGLWQRAFCYYLVDSLVKTGPRLADFHDWLASITGPNPTSAQRLFPTEMGWQRELREASNRSLATYFSWDDSATELAAAEIIALPKGKYGNDTRICTIETVSTFPRTKELTEAIRKKILELTELELRAHISWRPIIALYRFGLTALISDKDPTHAPQFFKQAIQQRAAEMENHQQLVDYANWYEVTQIAPLETSNFQSYFRVADQLDKAEPDPAHPNPLRARLLKVEAQF